MRLSTKQRDTILIVDDSRSFRMALARFLDGEGYDVILAEDGRDGLEKLQQHDPQIVLMDVNMPHLNGFEAVRQLREFSSVPTLMLSVRGAEMDRCLGLAAGADSYLAKPFSASELLTRIRGLLDPQAASGGGKSYCHHPAVF